MQHNLQLSRFDTSEKHPRLTYTALLHTTTSCDASFAPLSHKCAQILSACMGSALCSPVPIFPGSYVPRSYIPRYLCSPVLSSPVPIFPGSYVPPNFACPVFPGSYVPQYLCSPRNNSTCPIFPGPYVPRVLCSPGPMFPGCFVRRVLYTHILNILWTTLTYQIWTSDNNVWRVSIEWTIERAIYCWNEWIYLIFHFHP